MESHDARTGIVAVGCDACAESVMVAPDCDLDPPWRRFVVVGMVGDFHACSDDHEAQVRRRFERPEV